MGVHKILFLKGSSNTMKQQFPKLMKESYVQL